MHPTAQRYLESQILTASPEQLVVILYDGAIRFCLRAQEALEAAKGEEAGDLLIRAQRIVLELLCALRPDANPEISRNLSNLYVFMYEELVWANISRDTARIHNILPLLETLREGWSIAIEKAKEKRGEG